MNLLTYSSKTGNTKKVAEAIAKSISAKVDLLPMNEVKDVNAYDKIILGFWIDKGTANDEALDFLETVKSKKIGYFFTLGAYPDSEHSKNCHTRIREIFEKNGNEILADFCCQGKIDPALTKRFEAFPKGHHHYMDEERRARHAEAAKHPNEEDFKKAIEAFKDFF